MNINQIKLDNKFKLVEASAGTGKSFTLAHIVLRNVLEKKIKPEEILLLSFTKNTCSELRDKILSRFRDLKLFLHDQNVNQIDDTLREWYLNFYKKEKSKIGSARFHCPKMQEPQSSCQLKYVLILIKLLNKQMFSKSAGNDALHLVERGQVRCGQ